MIQHLRITVLADNVVGRTDVLAEHGFSALIEADGFRLLFDTGQGRVLRHNCSALGVSLSPLDALVLSHGHYDHTGGLPAVIEQGCPSVIYAHPAALEPKFARRDTPPFRPIGMPEAALAALRACRGRWIDTSQPVALAPGVWCTGPIPRTHPEEDEDAPRFFLDAKGWTPDPLPDDQALVLSSARGPVVVTGCAHAGLINTLDHACALAGSQTVYAVLGGLHLGHASPHRLESTRRALAARGVRLLAPLHCTGMRAQAYLQCHFPFRVNDAGAGLAVTIE